MDRPLFLRELEARRSIFEARAQFLHLIRDHFRSQGFLEVDAPLLVPAAGMEPHLDPFEARGWATGAEAFLPTSPEFYLKKLLAAGVARCFSLAPSFRDEPPGRGHSPEFLMLEWYRAGETMEALLADCAGLLAELGGRFLPDGTLVRDGVRCSFTSGLEVMTLSEAFVRYAGADWQTFETVTQWRDAAMTLGASGTATWSENDCFSFLMVHAVEPRLAAVPRPVALVGYPAFQAALARLNPADPRISERFELYAGGVELANAYTELTHAGEQRTRFAVYQRERAASGKVPHPEDAQFMQAVEYLPPCTGIALGADRLLALLLNESVARVRHGA